MQNTQLLFGVTIVPGLVGLVQVAKTAGMPARFAPFLAILLGILAGIAQLEQHHWPWIQAATVGVGLGLSAIGLYAGSASLLTTQNNTNNAGVVTPATTTTGPAPLAGAIPTPQKAGRPRRHNPSTPVGNTRPVGADRRGDLQTPAAPPSSPTINAAGTPIES